MAKQIRKTATTAAQFDVASWRTALEVEATKMESGATRLLKLALEARGVVEVDTAREAFKHAFAIGVAAAQGCTFEEALTSRTVANRTSDCMAVFSAAKLPGSMPASLQRAAAEVRKLPENKKGERGRQAPKAPKAPAAKVDAKDVKPLALLSAALDALKGSCGDNAKALELVGELVDLAADLAEALAS